MTDASFSELLAARHSVRAFKPDPIPEETLAAILEDARHAPSWSNTRPYCLALATGDALERLRAAYTAAFDASLGLQRRDWRAMTKAVLLGVGKPDGDYKPWRPYPEDLRPRSVQVGKELYAKLGIARGDRLAREAAARRNCEFFGAPAMALLFVHAGLLPFSAQDAGLMLQTLMLSATAHGVDTCALGTLATWRHPADAEFDIPKHYKLITGLALGYASDDPVNEFRAEHPPLVLLPRRRPDR